MFEFFDELAPENLEQVSEIRADKIRSSVFSRIEEEKPMKKHFGIKPLIIAAAVAVTGAASVVTANAATDGAVAEKLTKTISFVLNGEKVNGEVTVYETEDGVDTTEVQIDLPDNVLCGEETFYIVEDGEGEYDIVSISSPSGIVAYYPADIENNDYEVIRNK